MNRNLDGCYFRVKRGDKYENVCCSDLSPAERELAMFENRSAEWWRSLANHLADRIQLMGELFDIVGK